MHPGTLVRDDARRKTSRSGRRRSEPVASLRRGDWVGPARHHIASNSVTGERTPSRGSARRHGRAQTNDEISCTSASRAALSATTIAARQVRFRVASRTAVD